MSNSSRYVQTNINNSALIPQSVPSDYPLLLSSDGMQHLSQLLQQYQYGDDLYTYYAANTMPISATLQTAFEQTQSVEQVWGLDSETTYTLTLVQDGSLAFTIQWLDVDNNTYREGTGTASNLAGLVNFLNTNISTITVTVNDLVLTLTPNTTSPNQLVRINLTNLELSAYSFTAQNVPAEISATISCLLSQVPAASNFYAVVVEGNLFYPNLNDGSQTKIAAQVALANAIESTQNQGDYRKVLVISTQDPNVLNASITTDIMSQLKALNLQRSMVAYYAGNAMMMGLISARFALTAGNSDFAYTTVKGISYQYLSDAAIDVIYELDDQGNLSPTCKNGNYYDNAASCSFFYPGITPSGLPFDVTILADHIARDCRYAQIALLNKCANTGQDVPYNQSGINQMVSVIKGIMNNYLQQGLISPINNKGESCVIKAPNFAEIQANPALAQCFTNRVLTGISINFVPAGGINKVVETFYAVI